MQFILNSGEDSDGRTGGRTIPSVRGMTRRAQPFRENVLRSNVPSNVDARRLMNATCSARAPDQALPNAHRWTGLRANKGKA